MANVECPPARIREEQIEAHINYIHTDEDASYEGLPPDQINTITSESARLMVLRLECPDIQAAFISSGKSKFRTIFDTKISLDEF